jgi:carbamate kinase
LAAPVTDQTSPLRSLAVIAFGGNALLEPEDHGTIAEQRAHAEEAAQWLVELTRRDHDVVVVHGNGPQVGQVLIQMEEGATKVPPGTLDIAVAETQGSVGFLLETALRNRFAAEGIGREVVTMLSIVVVDRDDPGFVQPTKPVGPFYPRFRAAALERDHGWSMAEDAGRGWRKVVASPRPLEVLGVPALRQLLACGHVVIAGGGGGIPVVREGAALVGVEAVIDKDRTAALLARELAADLLVILTGVAQVVKNFGRKNAQPIAELNIRQARQLLGMKHFPAGSMGPKIEAAIDFVEATGREAVITDIEHLAEALAGRHGTRIRQRHNSLTLISG